MPDPQPQGEGQAYGATVSTSSGDRPEDPTPDSTEEPNGME